MAKIIHISDLHFHEAYPLEKVMGALCKDIRENGKDADVVIFSGDLAAKGNTSDKFIDGVFSNFIDPIKKCFDSEIPFLICPGNHDVDLKSRDAFYNPIFDGIKNSKQASDIFKSAEDPRKVEVWAHLDGFRKIAQKIDQDAYQKNPLYYTKKIAIGSKVFGFACLNSSWATRGGGAADYGKLFLCEVALHKAYCEIQDADVKIAVAHHPIFWLSEDEQAVINQYLMSHFNGFFCGHKHDNVASTIKSSLGSLFTSNTGCVYQSIEYYNGYSIINLDLNCGYWKVTAREYYSQRNEFGVSIRFSDNGEFESKYHYLNSAESVSIPSDVILAVNERANNLLLSSVASDLAPKSIGAMFVEPPLSYFSEKELFTRYKDGNIDSSAYVSFEKISQLPENIIFVGKREAGKSILLHHIATSMRQKFHYSARLGVVVDYAALKKNTDASILTQMVEFCGSEIPKKDIISLLNNGEILVCIDNCKLHDNDCVKLISGFVDKYSKTKFIFATSEEVVSSILIGDLPRINGVQKRIYIHSFRKKHTKELIDRWFGESDCQNDERLTAIEQLVVRLRVPRTPFLVSVLSWVMEQRPQFNVINHSSAIEVLIEGLLEKFTESKFRKEVDSTIQQHFLTEFANHLNSLDVEWITTLEFDTFITKYFNEKGLQVGTEGFSSEFLRKGLLYSFDDRVGFKFDCFRAFFLAKKFAVNNDLWQLALQKNNVRKYVYELDLLTGLYRDRKDILKCSLDLCKVVFLEFSRSNEIGSVDEIESSIDGESIGLIEYALEEDDKSNNNSECEVEPPEAMSVDHDASRRRAHLPDTGGITQFYESLRAFSIILRNSELVSDVDLKRECFNLALEMWAAFTAMAVKVLNEGPENSTEEFDMNFSAQDKYQMLRAIFPQVLMSAMSESLATPKMEKFIIEKTNDAQLLIRTIAVFLAIDADSNDAPEKLKHLLLDLKKNSFVMEVVFFRLLSIVLLSNSKKNLASYRDSLGNSFVGLIGGKRNDIAVAKARFLNLIDKNFLISENKSK